MNSCFLLKSLRDRSFSNEINHSEFVSNFLCNIWFKWDEIATSDDAGRTGEKNEKKKRPHCRIQRRQLRNAKNNGVEMQPCIYALDLTERLLYPCFYVFTEL